MTKMLLIHHSNQLFETLHPPDPERPLFYWYTDRFVHFDGTWKYMYILTINPKEDNIHVRSRSNGLGFNYLHKDFLSYKKWREGGSGDNSDWVESGIVMSFDEIKPAVTLMARSYGSSRPSYLQTDYEIITPMKPFTKRVIKLFDGPYNDDFDAKPIRFTDIPELVDLIPDMKNMLPFKEINPDKNGNHHYEDWLPMVTKLNGIWI